MVPGGLRRWPVGCEWVNDLAALAHSHAKFRREFGPGGGWTMRDVFVIGWDGGGNPFGIHAPSGEVRIEDHDFGGVHRMAESFAHFLRNAITSSPRAA